MARVVVDVMPKREILDPQGKAVHQALGRLGFAGISAVRQGKRFELEIDGELTAGRLDQIRQAAGTLLANPVIEDFEVHTVDEAGGACSAPTAADSTAADSTNADSTNADTATATARDGA